MPVEARRAERVNEPWRLLPMVGVNDDYLKQAESTYEFVLRAPGFADDAAVWEALRTRDDVAILTRDMVFPTLDEGADESSLPPFMERQLEEDPEARAEFEREFQVERRLFDDFALDSAALPPVQLSVRPLADAFSEEFGFDPAPSDEALEAQDVEIIGVLESPNTLADSGLQLGPAAWARVTGEPFTGDEYYLKVVEGAEVRTVAQAVERTFLSSGLNAFVLAEQFAQGQELTRGILRLFQGFMALGLLVGIAALGVIMTRTVVERRQQVGVLRAIGFQPRMVAFSFLFEASFIALSGILIGTAAGVSLGRQIVLAFYTALAGDVSLPIPWLQIGGVVLLAYVFALLTTVIPAYQAARIYPAEALRYE
jgi:putative ABC transport system permease protein